MENLTNHEKQQYVVDHIKEKVRALLSKVPDEEKPEKDVTLAIQPVVPDPNNLIATADMITIDSDDISSVITQTADPNNRKVFNRTILFNTSGGPLIADWEIELSPEGIIPEVEEEEIFDAIQSLRPAPLSELEQLDALLDRSQRGFRVVQPGTYRRTI